MTSMSNITRDHQIRSYFDDLYNLLPTIAQEEKKVSRTIKKMNMYLNERLDISDMSINNYYYLTEYLAIKLMAEYLMVTTGKPGLAYKHIENAFGQKNVTLMSSHRARLFLFSTEANDRTSRRDILIPALLNLACLIWNQTGTKTQHSELFSKLHQFEKLELKKKGESYENLASAYCAKILKLYDTASTFQEFNIKLHNLINICDFPDEKQSLQIWESLLNIDNVEKQESFVKLLSQINKRAINTPTITIGAYDYSTLIIPLQASGLFPSNSYYFYEDMRLKENSTLLPHETALNFLLTNFKGPSAKAYRFLVTLDERHALDSMLNKDALTPEVIEMPDLFI